MDPAALVTLLTANPIAAGIVVVVLAVLAYKNKDTIKAGVDKVLGKTTNAAGDAKTKADAAGEKIKAKFEDILGDVGAVVGDLDASALDLSTRALYRHYLLHVDAADKDAVTAVFQQLLNINSKLPVSAPPVTA